jgi:hypothetical protein
MRAWIVIALLSSSAIARAGAPLKGDVLVWDNATLYAEPADGAAKIQLAKLDPSSFPAIVGRAFPMHVIGRDDDFIEVEPVTDGQCTGETLVADEVAHLHVFVKEDALAPVLVKAWRASFDDGSRLVLGVGEPVAPLDDGGVDISLDGVAIHADVPATSIGRAYQAITPKSLLPDHPRFELGIGMAGGIAGGTYTVPTMLFLHAASAVEHPQKGATLFPIQMRCGVATVVVPDEAIAPYKALDLPTMGMGRGYGADSYLIPKGTPLSTPAGRRAAVADDDIVIKPPAAGATTACFDAPVSVSQPIDAPTTHEEPIEHNKIELCAPVASLKRMKGLGGYGGLRHH